MSRISVVCRTPWALRVAAVASAALGLRSVAKRSGAGVPRRWRVRAREHKTYPLPDPISRELQRD